MDTPLSEKNKERLRKVDAARPYLHRAAIFAVPAAAATKAVTNSTRAAGAAAVLGAAAGMADKKIENMSSKKELKPVLKNYASDLKKQGSAHTKQADAADRLHRHQSLLSDLFPSASADQGLPANLHNTEEAVGKVASALMMQKEALMNPALVGRIAGGVVGGIGGAAAGGEGAANRVVGGVLGAAGGATAGHFAGKGVASLMARRAAAAPAARQLTGPVGGGGQPRLPGPAAAARLPQHPVPGAPGGAAMKVAPQRQMAPAATRQAPIDVPYKVVQGAAPGALLGALGGGALGAGAGALVGGPEHRVDGALAGGLVGAGLGAGAGRLLTQPGAPMGPKRWSDVLKGVDGPMPEVGGGSRLLEHKPGPLPIPPTRDHEVGEVWNNGLAAQSGGGKVSRLFGEGRYHQQSRYGEGGGIHLKDLERQQALHEGRINSLDPNKYASIDTSHDEKAGLNGRPAWGLLTRGAEQSNADTVNNMINTLSKNSHEMHRKTQEQVKDAFPKGASSYGRQRSIGRTAAEVSDALTRAFGKA